MKKKIRTGPGAHKCPVQFCQRRGYHLELNGYYYCRICKDILDRLDAYDIRENKFSVRLFRRFCKKMGGFLESHSRGRLVFFLAAGLALAACEPTSEGRTAQKAERADSLRREEVNHACLVWAFKNEPELLERATRITAALHARNTTSYWRGNTAASFLRDICPKTTQPINGD